MDLVIRGRPGPDPARGDGGGRRGARRRDRRGRAATTRSPEAQPSTSPTTRCCCPASSTPTCTSTSPAAPSGRASRPPPGPPPPAASPRSSTCRSTAIPPTVTVEALQIKRTAADGQLPRRRRLLGRRRPGQHRRPARRCTTRRVRLQVLPARTPGWTSSRRSRPTELDALPAPSSAGFGGLMIVHAEDGDALERAPPPHGREYAELPRLPAARRREPRHRGAHRGRPAHRRRGAHAAPVQLGRGADAALGPARRDRASPSRRARTTSSSRRSRSPRAPPQFKCCPPIREADNREDALGGARRAATSTCVVSDHSPCMPELKGLDHGDFGTAWGGIAVAADRPARRVDGGARGAGTASPTSCAGWPQRPAEHGGPHPEGPDRARLRRRPRRVRAGRRVRRRPGAALPPQPRHALRRPRPRRRGAAHLAARRTGRPTGSRAAA